MSITSYLNERGFYSFEGYSQQVPQQVKDLIELTKGVKNIIEIGFNAGHSAEIFLENNIDLILISFDLGKHKYINTAKEYIDLKYPNRHTLILGDSIETLPKFIEKNKDKKYDIIFIDGGHEYEIANQDIENSFNLSHKDTIIIVDDTIFRKNWEKSWTIGPTKAWLDNIKVNKIIEIGRKEYSIGRGMSWGKYKI